MRWGCALGGDDAIPFTRSICNAPAEQEDGGTKTAGQSCTVLPASRPARYLWDAEFPCGDAWRINKWLHDWGRINPADKKQLRGSTQCLRKHIGRPPKQHANEIYTTLECLRSNIAHVPSDILRCLLPGVFNSKDQAGHMDWTDCCKVSVACVRSVSVCRFSLQAATPEPASYLSVMSSAHDKSIPLRET